MIDWEALDLAALVRLTAHELRHVLPPEVTVAESDGELIVTTPNGVDYLRLRFSIEHLISEGESLNEAIVLATLEMLKDLQDIVTLTLTEPWPRAPTLSRRSDFLVPRAEISDDALCFWFGDRNADDVITVRVSIPFAD